MSFINNYGFLAMIILKKMLSYLIKKIFVFSKFVFVTIAMYLGNMGYGMGQEPLLFLTSPRLLVAIS